MVDDIAKLLMKYFFLDDYSKQLQTEGLYGVAKHIHPSNHYCRATFKIRT